MGVIIEYKGQNRIRIVESADERGAREYHNVRRVRKAKMVKVHSEIMGSSQKEGTGRPWWKYPIHSDNKCWKNQKHARKSWMRHIHRLKPSARSLVENCVYPNTTC